MPQGGTLSPKDLATIEAWIEAGAQPRGRSQGAQLFTASRLSFAPRRIALHRVIGCHPLERRTIPRDAVLDFPLSRTIAGTMAGRRIAGGHDRANLDTDLRHAPS